jgi:hypothetical protein
MIALSAYANKGESCSFTLIIHIIAPAPCLAEPTARGIADEMQHFLHILVIGEALLGFFQPIIENARFAEDQPIRRA